MSEKEDLRKKIHERREDPLMKLPPDYEPDKIKRLKKVAKRKQP